MKNLILPVFCSLIFCSSCRVYRGNEDNCRTWEISAPRNSTLTKNISREKCRYENGRVMEKVFTIDETGCFHHSTYYERGKEFYPGGKLRSRYHSLGSRETIREYYASGRLKKKEKVRKIRFSDAQMEKRELDSTVVYAPGVYRVRRKEIDSISGKVTRSVISDSLIVRARF